jgi:hypothetical protein
MGFEGVNPEIWKYELQIFCWHLGKPSVTSFVTGDIWYLMLYEDSWRPYVSFLCYRPGCLFTKDFTTTIKFCKYCHAFVLRQSYICILKLSKLIIPAYNETSILTWGLVAFCWVYRRNEILIVVVRSFVNRYPGYISTINKFHFF